MGFLKHVLFWPVTGPLFLAEFALGKVEGVVKEQLTDDTRIKAELMDLQLKLELGDIDDDQYIAAEAELMLQLREVREWKEQFGMGVSGGPVRVQSSAPQTDAADNDAGGESPSDDVAAERAPQVADPGGGVTINLNLGWD